MIFDWKRIGWFCLGMAVGTQSEWIGIVGIAGFLASMVIIRMTTRDY